MMGEKRPNFAIIVVWSATYAFAKTMEHEGSTSSSSFYGHLAKYYSHVFSLIHPADELSCKEIRTWGQSKISSCLFVKCKSRELEGRGSPRFSMTMVESFSADFLLALKSYWTESHLELCQI